MGRIDNMPAPRAVALLYRFRRLAVHHVHNIIACRVNLMRDYLVPECSTHPQSPRRNRQIAVEQFDFYWH